MHLYACGGVSHPTREGRVVGLIPLTFPKPGHRSCLPPQPHLNKKLLSLSRNPEARIMQWGLCQARSSAKRNGDICWSLDSRKTAHSSPPGFSGSGPSFPSASIDLDAWPSGWDLTLCLCVL